MTTIDTLFPNQTLIPVVVLDDAEDAVPLSLALLEGGITSIEITLRTKAGLHAIEAVASKVPEIIVGAGTVMNVAQMDAVAQAGAQFQVSPGMTPKLADYAHDHKVAWLPGVTNASQIMLAAEYGLEMLKFFPASLSGGVPMLKQFYSVFPQTRFCPTGGIGLGNLGDYATLPHVSAIGGSWLTPKDAIAEKDWKRISIIAKESMDHLREVTA